MFEHDFSVNTASNRALGRPDLIQSKCFCDWDRQLAAGRDFGNRLQRFGIGAMVKFVDLHATFGIGALRKRDDASNVATISHMLNEISGNGRCGADRVVERSTRWCRGDIECLARQLSCFFEPVGPDASHRVCPDFLEILDRSPTNCAKSARDQDAIARFDVKSIDRLPPR